MAPKRFEKRLNILVTDDEHRMIGELARRDGMTPSDVVRQFIRRRHAEVFGEQPAKPTKPRKR